MKPSHIIISPGPGRPARISYIALSIILVASSPQKILNNFFAVLR
jgi:anthranilate/para-aminobenzoate synthase component II